MEDVEEADQTFEEELQRNPNSAKTWYLYIGAKAGDRPVVRNLLAERAVKHLPGSYKIWATYLRDRVKQCEGLRPDDVRYKATNNAFERGITFMHKMPRFWLMYLEFLIEQKMLTRIRKTFDRALMSLPITQHERIWPVYMKFVRMKGVPPEVACRIYRRFTMLEYENLEERVKFLKSVGRLDEAAILLAKIVNDENFVSKRGLSKHKLWLELCGLMCKNPFTVTSLDVDAILRGAIRRYVSEIGRLWTNLADYYIRLAQFEKARDIFEEGITSVSTVRDFEIVYNQYTEFENTMLEAKMGVQEAREKGDDDYEDMREEKDITPEYKELLADFDVDADDMDLRLSRLESLANRRELLINSVLLRQNPHNVQQWLERVKIFKDKDKPLEVIKTFVQAVQTVKADKASGRPHKLWVQFARYYEDFAGDLENARQVFQKAVKYPFKAVDDLATIWCEWAEMEVRNEEFEPALKLLQQATNLPNERVLYGQHSYDPKAPVSERLYRSTKLWSMYVDLEECFGSLPTTRAVYDRILDLRIATPQIVINYAKMLEEHNYFEDSFRVFEKGVALFKFPHVFLIWMTYLRKFVERYKSTKIERARELFEQAVTGCPRKHAKQLYLLFADFEEKYGGGRRAMAVYDRACEEVETTEKYEMYMLYIKRTADLFGGPAMRDVYEKAIKNLPDARLPTVCLRYAQLEIKLGEVDRARGILVYSAQFADPRKELAFWKEWERFEENHGNHETYTEMMRVKRSTSAQYINTIQLSGFKKGETMVLEGEEPRELSEMEKLEREKLAEDKEKGPEKVEGRQLQAADTSAAHDPDEIDLDVSDDDEDEDDDDEDEDDEKASSSQKASKSTTSMEDDGDLEVTQKAVPDSVFGEAAPLRTLVAEKIAKEQALEDHNAKLRAQAEKKAAKKEMYKAKAKAMGAKERLKNKKRKPQR